MIVISYGTKGKFTKGVERLRKSCQDLGLPHDIELFDDWGARRKHCHFKPRFIDRKLREHNQMLMWIDADAELLKAPSIDDDETSFDFGFVTHPSAKPPHIFAGSCHFHNPTETQFKFLKNWMGRMTNESRLDHILMIEAFKDMGPHLRSRDVAHWMKGCYIRNKGKKGEMFY